MAGTHAGGIAARDANLKRNPNHYRMIGKIGGSNGNTGGTYNNPEWASKIGKLGGQLSKIGFKYLRSDAKYNYYLNKKTGKKVKFNVKTN